MARLQRFDRAQEEAALDLGASYPQVFWHILLPFLKPALISAAVIAFLSSLRELQHHDLRHPRRQDAGHGAGGRGAPGHDAGSVALAVIIIGISLVGAIIYEILRRREERVAADRARAAREAEREGLAAVPQAASSRIH